MNSLRRFRIPKKKITLIEKSDLSDVKEFKGISFSEKCKMFAVASSQVRDDMDVFWCTDMDEFFRESLIGKVEQVYESSGACTIIVPHILYFWDHRFILAHPDGRDLHPFSFARITRHVPGRIYGHCTLDEYVPVTTLTDEYLHHFTYVGDARVRAKSRLYKEIFWYVSVWKQFNPDKIPERGVVTGRYHPRLHLGLKRSSYNIPEYIDTASLNRALLIENSPLL